MRKNTLLVVMPVYNAEETLEKAIKSILDQDHKNLILTIVDDCSTDGSLGIAKKFLSDSRVRLYRSSVNLGAYYSRNFGLHISKDLDWDFFTTHDSDDVSFRNRYKNILKAFDDNSRINGIQDMFDRIDLKTGTVVQSKLTMAHAVFRRSVFENIGYFDNVRFGGDWEYWYRLNEFNKHSDNKFRTAGINKILGESYIHDNNLTVRIPENSAKRTNYVKKVMARTEAYPGNNGWYYGFDLEPKKTRKVTELFTVDKKVTIVLMTWKRIPLLHETLRDLSQQTYKHFDLHISNGNLDSSKEVDKIVKSYSKLLKISTFHDGNEYKSFRRFFAAKRAAEAGSEVILFLDDDIEIPADYVEKALKQYEPKTYKSGFAWSFNKRGRDYHKFRTRRFDNAFQVHYCGTGISMIDASIFLDDGLFNAPENAMGIEDLWLSYYAQHVIGWKLQYMETARGTRIGGDDAVALYKQYLNAEYTKTDFLRELVRMGWQLPA